MIIKREMSSEKVANFVETALDELPYVEIQYEQAKQAADRLQEKVDYLQNRKSTLGIKEKYRIITLPSSSNSYVNESETSSFSLGPSSLPYLSSENYDPWGEYRKNKRTQ
jgi:cell division septum initiation protein DivIVA